MLATSSFHFNMDCDRDEALGATGVPAYHYTNSGLPPPQQQQQQRDRGFYSIFGLFSPSWSSGSRLRGDFNGLLENFSFIDRIFEWIHLSGVPGNFWKFKNQKLSLENRFLRGRKPNFPQNSSKFSFFHSEDLLKVKKFKFPFVPPGKLFFVGSE